jgi:ArsR family transcriptional regulator
MKDAYRALADPTRRQILKLLREGDLPAGAIAEQFAMSWPSVSRHLGVLAATGLVTATRRGQQLIYSLTTSVLADIVTELADMARLNQPRTPAAGSSEGKVTSGRYPDGDTAECGERRLGDGGVGVS